MKNYKIAVAGTGYVGLSLAVLLSQKNEVTAVDIVPEKVEKLNKRISPIQDKEIEEYLATKDLNLRATTDGVNAYKDAEFVIIAAPTNYDPQKNFFDTSAVESVIELVMASSDTATMVIKSTIPVGYTDSVRKKYGTDGCDVLVLLRRNGRGEELLKENGIRYLKIKSYNWIIPDHPSSLFRKAELCVRLVTKPFAQLYNQLAIVRIKKLIRDEKVDIVHQNTSYIYAPAKAAIKSDVPLVWHLREFLEEDQHKRIWNRKSGYGLISKASAVITISDSLYNKYEKLLKNTNLLKIYNGIDASYYASSPRTLFQNDKTKILMVGTINESKGQAQAIEACKRLVDKGFKDFILTIVGDMTKYAQNLKDRAERLGIVDNVRFVGLQKDTVKYYHQADIVLVCSRFEAFGRVTVEAMMGGCVVIGANTGGTIELIEDSKTGYLWD